MCHRPAVCRPHVYSTCAYLVGNPYLRHDAEQRACRTARQRVHYIPMPLQRTRHKYACYLVGSHVPNLHVWADSKCCSCLQFETTLEINIEATVNTPVNVTITNVVAGSVKVTNTVAFTGSNSAAALAGQSALATLRKSGDVSSVFGSTFGSVTVSGVTLGTASNPSKYTLLRSQTTSVVC